METAKEAGLKRVKRQKSPTRYPKRMNTFVVAFAVQDPQDDTAKSSTPKKRHSEKSLMDCEPVLPTGSNTSTKTFTIGTAADPTQSVTVTSVNEVNNDIIKESQSNAVEIQSPQSDKLAPERVDVDDEHSRIMSPDSKKRFEGNRKLLRRKLHKYKYCVKLKNNNFKNKKFKTNTTKELDKNCIKMKMILPQTKLKEMHSSSISKVVSRSQILQTKETANLIDNLGQLPQTDSYFSNDNDSGSLNSSASTAKRFSSYNSQSTLMNKSFSTVNSDDFHSMKSSNSLGPMPLKIMPYKSDIINVSVAVAFTPSNTNTCQPETIPSDTDCHDEGNVTSTETILFTGMELTSQAPSEESSKKANPMNTSTALNENDQSSEIIVPIEEKSLKHNSEEDMFRIVQSSSELNKSSIISDMEEISNSETTLKSENLQDTSLLHSATTLGLHNNIFGRDALLDTVIKLGFYPEMTPSTSSGPNFDNDFNDVLVTENLMNYPHMPNNKDNNCKITSTQNELSRNVLSKPIDTESDNQFNNISLPNEVAIKTALEETDNLQKTKSNLNLPNLTEMWERMTLVLDLAVKNLENSLASKIMKELNASLPTFLRECSQRLKSETSLPEFKHAEMLTEEHKLELLHKEVIVIEDEFRNSEDQCLQCNLIHNQVIDQIMLKLSVEGPKAYNSQISLVSLKKPQTVQEHVTDLKQPSLHSNDDVEVGRGDTTSVGTATAEVMAKEYRRLFHSSLCSSPMTFFRENLLVITSVPTFFVILFCLYGVFTSIAKSW